MNSVIQLPACLEIGTTTLKNNFEIRKKKTNNVHHLPARNGAPRCLPWEIQARLFIETGLINKKKLGKNRNVIKSYTFKKYTKGGEWEG